MLEIDGCLKWCLFSLVFLNEMVYRSVLSFEVDVLLLARARGILRPMFSGLEIRLTMRRLISGIGRTFGCPELMIESGLC